MILLYIWILLFGFVGTQLAWTLRPLYGSPGAPFELFRDIGGTRPTATSCARWAVCSVDRQAGLAPDARTRRELWPFATRRLSCWVIGRWPLDVSTLGRCRPPHRRTGADRSGDLCDGVNDLQQALKLFGSGRGGYVDGVLDAG